MESIDQIFPNSTGIMESISIDLIPSHILSTWGNERNSNETSSLDRIMDNYDSNGLKRPIIWKNMSEEDSNYYSTKHPHRTEVDQFHDRVNSQPPDVPHNHPMMFTDEHSEPHGNMISNHGGKYFVYACTYKYRQYSCLYKYPCLSPIHLFRICLHILLPLILLFIQILLSFPNTPVLHMSAHINTVVDYNNPVCQYQ